MKSCCKDAFDNETVQVAKKPGIISRLFSFIIALFARRKQLGVQEH